MSSSCACALVLSAIIIHYSSALWSSTALKHVLKASRSCNRSVSYNGLIVGLSSWTCLEVASLYSYGHRVLYQNIGRSEVIAAGNAVLVGFALATICVAEARAQVGCWIHAATFLVYYPIISQVYVWNCFGLGGMIGPKNYRSQPDRTSQLSKKCPSRKRSWFTRIL